MWNNRIIKHEKDGVTWYSVHEVFYNEDGSIYAYTEDPITIVGETKSETIKQVEQILRDIKDTPVLVASEIEFKEISVSLSELNSFVPTSSSSSCTDSYLFLATSFLLSKGNLSIKRFPPRNL